MSIRPWMIIIGLFAFIDMCTIIKSYTKRRKEELESYSNSDFISEDIAESMVKEEYKDLLNSALDVTVTLSTLRLLDIVFKDIEMEYYKAVCKLNSGEDISSVTLSKWSGTKDTDSKNLDILCLFQTLNEQLEKSEKIYNELKGGNVSE